MACIVSFFLDDKLYLSLSLLCITPECTELRQETTPTMMRLSLGMAPPAGSDDAERAPEETHK